MKINIEYNIKAQEGIEKVSNQEVTFNYISAAVNQKYEKGIEGGLRRMWGRIQRKFDDAITANADEITLDQSEKDFIKRCVSDCRYHPAVAKYIQLLEDEIASWDK